MIRMDKSEIEREEGIYVCTTFFAIFFFPFRKNQSLNVCQSTCYEAFKDNDLLSARDSRARKGE